jgi:hypothetical protein
MSYEQLREAEASEVNRVACEDGKCVEDFICATVRATVDYEIWVNQR